MALPIHHEGVSRVGDPRGLLSKAKALVASKRSHGSAVAAAHTKVCPLPSTRQEQAVLAYFGCPTGGHKRRFRLQEDKDEPLPSRVEVIEPTHTHRPTLANTKKTTTQARASGGGEGQDTTAARLVHGVEGRWCVATGATEAAMEDGRWWGSARRRKDSVAGPSVGRGPPAVVGRAEEGSTSGGVVRVWTWRGGEDEGAGGGWRMEEATEETRRATRGVGPRSGDRRWRARPVLALEGRTSALHTHGIKKRRGRAVEIGLR
ncbi:hypothetical protein GUJ93_ZPchr0005g14655 [Zizania palustris]|uniref:Uncharacterized protein n=1 Tax=Zizania palustris TaxID=103762 RepID=A0A8J5S304_ZIZPA|nr:hypothetical protein GUJ93_ZPchr0005g14655 [Zizania palustris]